MSAVGGHRLLGASLQWADQSMERRIEAKAALLIGDPEFWQVVLASKNPVSDAVQWQLPRLMANLDDACKLETRPEVWHYAVQAILAALHQIQKQAKARARELAREAEDDGDE